MCGNVWKVQKRREQAKGCMGLLKCQTRLVVFNAMCSGQNKNKTKQTNNKVNYSKAK